MKKNIYIMLILLILPCIVLTGCALDGNLGQVPLASAKIFENDTVVIKT